jgi:hypothetical protein
MLSSGFTLARQFVKFARIFTVFERVEYTVTLTGLAQANMSGLEFEAGMTCNRVLVIAQTNIYAMCREASEPGSHIHIIGVLDCPGGPMAIKVNVDDVNRLVTVLEIQHPANLVSD